MMILSGKSHVRALAEAVLRLDTGRLEEWGQLLATWLVDGARLLVASTGRSVAEAQHLTAELADRFHAE